MPRKPTATIRMVAKEVNLSVATVSRALKGSPQVSEETRKRVRDAANRLSYRRNMLMQGVLTGRTMTIGVLMPLGTAFLDAIFAGIHDGLAARRHLPVLLRSNPESASGVDDLGQIKRLVEHRVDGIILFPHDYTISDASLKEIDSRKMPLVVVDVELPQICSDFVGCDDEAIGRLAAQHLLNLGHRRLGHLAGPTTTSSGLLRRKGFERAVILAGASCHTVVARNYEGDVEEARRLLGEGGAITGIFAANDLLARALYAAAADLKLSLPGDLSIVGSANLEFSRWLVPSLTSVNQFPSQIGRIAADLLLDRLDGRTGAPSSIRVAPELVIRSSTAPPRG